MMLQDKNQINNAVRNVMSDPIAAIATALAPAALGIVRTSGKGSLEIVSGIFSRPEALLNAPSHSLVHGWILECGSGEPVDEVVAAVYRAPSGFTGEDAVEIICHGGSSVVTAVYSSLLKAGFRPAEGGEFSLRAFAGGKTDLTRAEAINEIISAKTSRARKKASARLAGSVAAAFAEIRAKILEAAAAVSVEIEYPEDEETVKGSFNPSLVESALESLRLLSSTWSSEKLYQSGAEIVLAGATNAGKSKLFNILLKEDRAIVSDIHGTTRDWIEAEADFSGIPVRLFDTAGLRETEDKIEAEGIARTRELLQRADIVFYTVDSSAGFTGEDAGFFRDGGGNNIPVFIVWNKTDKENSLPPEKFREQFSSFGLDEKKSGVAGVFPVSAKTGAGLEALVKAAAETLLAKTEGAASGAALGSLRQKETALTVESYLQAALDNAENGFPLDAVVQDLDDALFAIGEITGETVSADVLDTVFSKFCVGK